MTPISLVTCAFSARRTKSPDSAIALRWRHASTRNATASRIFRQSSIAIGSRQHGYRIEQHGGCGPQRHLNGVLLPLGRIFCASDLECDQGDGGAPSSCMAAASSACSAGSKPGPRRTPTFRPFWSWGVCAVQPKSRAWRKIDWSNCTDERRDGLPRHSELGSHGLGQALINHFEMTQDPLPYLRNLDLAQFKGQCFAHMLLFLRLGRVEEQPGLRVVVAKRRRADLDLCAFDNHRRRLQDQREFPAGDAGRSSVFGS